MKQLLKSNGVFILMFILAIVLPSLVHAQDPGPDPDVPLDGGLSVLIAAGVGYGLKKVRQERKKRTA